MFLSKIEDFFEVGRIAKSVLDNDGFGIFGDFFLKIFRVKI